MKRLAMVGVVGLLGLSALGACGDDDDTADDVQDANAAFCSDLTVYGTAVKGLADLDPTTATKDDYESAADEVRSTREDVVDSGKDLSEAEWTNLQTQIETLGDQLRDAPDDVSVSSILADADAQATTVQASIATLNTAICTAGGPTTATG